MKKRRSSLLQRMIAVLLSVVLVVCMVWGAEPINALAKENGASPESGGLQEGVDGNTTEISEGGIIRKEGTESEENTNFEGQEETVTEDTAETVTENAEETVTEDAEVTLTENAGETVTEGTEVTVTEQQNVMMATEETTKITRLQIEYALEQDDINLFREGGKYEDKVRPVAISCACTPEYTNCEITYNDSDNGWMKKDSDGYVKYTNETWEEGTYVYKITIKTLDTNYSFDETVSISDPTGEVWTVVGFSDDKSEVILHSEDVVKVKSADIASGTDWVLDGNGKLWVSSNKGVANWKSDENGWNQNRSNVISLEIGSNVTLIVGSAFFRCNNLTSIIIPKNVRIIGDSAFADCESVTSITILENLTTIDSNAFGGCTKLKNVTLPDNMTSIGKYMFRDCSSLTDITLPESVTSIGEFAFAGCQNLRKITIPSAVMEIGGYAFLDCASLECITFLEDVPPTLGDKVFGGDFYADIGILADGRCGFVKKGQKGIHVPAGKMETYKNATEKWKEWEDYITDVAAPAETHEHNDLTFTAWTAKDSLPTDGAYFLTEDVAVSDSTIITDTLILCLNGHTVSMTAGTKKEIFKVEGGGSLTLYDCSGNHGCLTGGYGISMGGGAVCIQGGSFTMNGGTLSGNAADGNAMGGGAVYVTNGSFTMNGGVISGNTSYQNDDNSFYCGGGGVRIASDATFTMNGGKILNNTANKAPGNNRGGDGGGVYVAGGTFIMNGGEISSNQAAARSGGVHLNICKFIMNDGTISGNTAATIGGGVYKYKGTFTMSGGTISDNKATNGGGIYASYGASWDKMTLSGAVSIMGNTKMDGIASSNIYLDDMEMTIEQGFSTGSAIGVSTKSVPTSCGETTTVAKGAVNAETLKNFTSELGSDSGCSLEYADGVIQFEMPHTYTDDSDMICDVCGYERTLPDTQPPTGTITIGNNSWSGFLNAFTFGLFFKETKQVTIEAADEGGSGADKTYYYISDEGLSAADVKALGETDWTEGTSFSIDPDRKCIIYAKITDKAGNVSYLSSDGLVFDGTPPAIYDVRDGETYYGASKSGRVIDTNLESVTVNGQEVTLMHEEIFLLEAADGPQTIVATDKAGNTTTITVTIKAESHTHNLNPVAAKDASCTEAGNKAYYICDGDDGCGRWFSDAEGSLEITVHDSVVIPATGHSYDNSAWGYQGADGHAHKCRNCDVHDTTEAHTPGPEATATTPQICMDCGYIIKPATGTEPAIGTVTPEVKLGGNAPVTNISTPIAELINMLLTEAERQQVQNGTNIRIVLEVQDAGNTVSALDKSGIQQALNDFTVGQYLNINLYKLVGENRTDITETEKKIRVIITIPGSLKNTDGEKTRTYAVMRAHNGKAELLADTDDSADTITIETDRFSTYAIVYKDTSNGGDDNGGSGSGNGNSGSGNGNDNGGSGNGNGNSGSDNGNDNGGNGNSNDNGGKGNKPETGDAAPVELAATLAMIAGFSYLLLYFANRRRGMTEETKQELVSRIVMWAKQGGKIRRILALIAVFVLLAYYHSIGKKICAEWKEIYEG